MKQRSKEQRTEIRSLCADLVQLEWKDASGRVCVSAALLEDISPKGACLQLEAPVPENIEVSVSHGANWSMICQTVYCMYREIGYFVGIRFDDRLRWSEVAFRPQHLLNLSDLIESRMPVA